MAICISTNMSSIRGSIAGTTYLTTPSGQIIARQRTRPTQPQTGNQTKVRMALSEANAQWHQLTEAERESWQWGEVSMAVARQRFLAQWTLIAMYNRYASVSVTPHNTNVASVPAYLTLANIAYDGAVGSTGISLTAENPFDYVQYAIAQVSRNFAETRYRYTGAMDADATQCVPVAASTKVTVSFSGLVEGEAYFVRVVPLTVLKIGGGTDYGQDHGAACWLRDIAQTAEA